MSPLKRLLIVVAVQLLVLFGVIGFKQYTLWTGQTVLIEAAPVDPRDPFRGDYVTLRFDISTIDLTDVPYDGSAYGSRFDYGDETVYVELREDDDGYWKPVALHDDRDRSQDGTVLLKAHVKRTYASAKSGDRVELRYGFEDIFIPEGSGSDIPWDRGHTLALKLKVDRFGNAVARELYLDGKPLDPRRNG